MCIGKTTPGVFGSLFQIAEAKRKNRQFYQS